MRGGSADVLKSLHLRSEAKKEATAANRAQQSQSAAESGSVTEGQQGSAEDRLRSLAGKAGHDTSMQLHEQSVARGRGKGARKIKVARKAAAASKPTTATPNPLLLDL